MLIGDHGVGSAGVVVELFLVDPHFDRAVIAAADVEFHWFVALEFGGEEDESVVGLMLEVVVEIGERIHKVDRSEAEGRVGGIGTFDAMEFSGSGKIVADAEGVDAFLGVGILEVDLRTKDG